MLHINSMNYAYLMLVIDGNGQSEIVSLFLTSLETKAAITDMINAFKSANPSWSKKVWYANPSWYGNHR